MSVPRSRPARRDTSKRAASSDAARGLGTGLSLAEVMGVLERMYPPFLRDPRDPPMLAVGRSDKRVRRVALALDAVPGAVEAARRAGADMLLAHHPPFFRAPRTLAGDTEAGDLVRAAMDADMAVAAVHIALDQSPGGTADALADALGLLDTEILLPNVREPLFKLVVFAPESHGEALRSALDEAGAGRMGDYSGCSFVTRGEGSFRPEEGARPFIGSPGEVSRVEEWRIETLVPESGLSAALSAMRRAHPYEVPAHDVYPMKLSRDFGPGRVGRLPKPMDLPALAALAASATGAGGGLWAGKANPPIERVAVWPGSGFPLECADPVRFGAVVTGELGYHEQLALASTGVRLVLLGHDVSERPVLPRWAKELSRALPGVLVKPVTHIPFPLRHARGRLP